MPTYEYKCQKCGYEFDEFQKMTDEPLRICRKCAGELKRLIGTGAGPIFKGNGFYQTDYKNNNNSKSGLKAESQQSESYTKDVGSSAGKEA
ncbi:MAG: zinc ribbon domain-containing protein [Melioribacteraceae bacterium]|nr:zinc ribbon domain-containing protein [Melioribacteraceae bacterium]MCO6474034.1 zinc ribbon domain-containing protein [Melioribacteraceae bacterium]MDD3557112.1 zinc ribbon domain-containing protein [Melioribacteraceae bacterium]